MDTAEETKRIDPMRCVICQQSVGRHPMKVKIDRKVRRICNRVDEEHADWLLDNRMDVNYLRITNKRRGGILGIIVLMLAFVALIWAFIYTTGFEPVFVAVAGALSAAIVLFVVSEFRTITVSDRMRSMLHKVEVDRPIIPPEPHPSLERLDEIAALAGEAEPEMGRVSIHSVEPAPTQASGLPTLAPEDGVPGFPQPVVTPKEWEIMDVGDQGPGAPQPAPGTPTPPVPTPPVPAPPTIEDLPEETAPAPAPGTRPPVPPGWPPAPAVPPVAPPPPPQVAIQQPPPPPPVAAPPAPIGELPSEAARPSPPSQTLASQSPPSPPPRTYQPPAPPPVQQYPAQVPPPVQQYPAQVPPPSKQSPAQVPPPTLQTPPQVPPPTPPPPAQAPPAQQVPQRKPKAPDKDVEEAEWVDWE